MKKWQKILISVGALMIIVFVGYRIHDYWIWRTPYQNQTEPKELLSDKTHELTEEQEAAFYDIARGAIRAQDKDIKFTNLDDYSLYVKKDKGKNKYYIDYVCKSPNFKIKFDTEITIKINAKTLKGDTHFKILDLDSDLINIDDYDDDDLDTSWIDDYDY